MAADWQGIDRTAGVDTKQHGCPLIDPSSPNQLDNTLNYRFTSLSKASHVGSLDGDVLVDGRQQQDVGWRTEDSSELDRIWRNRCASNIPRVESGLHVGQVALPSNWSSSGVLSLEDRDLVVLQYKGSQNVLYTAICSFCNGISQRVIGHCN
eukprot:scaffold2048_cov224-Pinguiococcus_pyrenoidosus.AAC.10